MTKHLRPSLLKHACIASMLIAYGGCFAATGVSQAKPTAGGKAESLEYPITSDCKQQMANEKVMLLLAERYTNGMNATQSRYDVHGAEIERRFQQQGMSFLNREDLKKKMIQPEIDAHFVVDPSKAQRVVQKQDATLTLRGLITSRRAFSPIRKTTETYVSLNLALVDVNGFYISEAVLNSESSLGADTLGMVLDLIKQRGDDAVLKILSGYCAPRKQELKQ